MTDCPSEERLRALLQGDNPAADGELVDHVEACAACQTRLGELTGAAPGAADAAGPLPPFLERLKALAGETQPGATLPEAGWPALPAAAGGGGGGVGRYRVLRKHAEGGLGAVHLAYDCELRREVALKEMKGRHADHPEVRARFLREAEVTGTLEHPGIVPVYGLGVHPDGRPYYTMRFIRGETLGGAIERFHEAGGPLHGARLVEFRKLLARFLDACQAVAYANSRGVLHRDLKPSNIMLGPFGETLVVDWGLAKVVGVPGVAEEPEPEPGGPAAETPPWGGTVPGRAMGTPAYMSPEQAEGRVDEVGPASDVYSLGATLYTLLTGHAPFEGGDVAATLGRVRRGEFSPPRERNPEIPRSLEAICRRAMALSPADRYASARELAADVENWLADEPVKAWPVGTLGQAWRWCRRHRALAGLLAAAVVAAVASAAALVSNHYRAELAQLVADLRGSNRDLQATQEELAAAVRQVRRQAYVTDMNLAHQAWRDGDVARLDALLGKYQRPAPGADPRGFEWRHLAWLRDRRAGEATVGGAAGPPLHAVAAAGGWVAAAGRELKVRPAAGAAAWRTVATAGETGPFQALAFTPDGGLLAAADAGGQVRVWRAGTWEQVRQWREDQAPVPLAFRGDGKQLLTGVGEAVRTRRVGNWEPGPQFFTGGTVCGLASSPDGKLVAACDNWGNVAVREDDGDGGYRPLWQQSGHADLVCAAAFSPDGRRLATASYDHTVKVWDAEGGRQLQVFRGHALEVLSVAFSPRGHLLASGGWDRTVKVWDLDYGEEVQSLSGSRGVVRQVAFTPDGAQVLAAGDDGSVRGWAADRDDRSIVLTPPDRGVAQALAFHPAGNILAAADGSGQVRVWDIAKAQEVQTYYFDRGLAAVGFSPSGGHLLAAWPDRRLEARPWPAGDGPPGDQPALSPWPSDDGAAATPVLGHGLAAWVGPEAVWLCRSALSPAGELSAAGAVRQNLGLPRLTAPPVPPVGPGAKAGRDPGNEKPRPDPNLEKLRLTPNAGKQRPGPKLGKAAGAAAPSAPALPAAAISPDGQRLAVARRDGVVAVVPLAGGPAVLLETPPAAGPPVLVNDLTFSPDGRSLAGAGQDHSVVVWDLQRGARRWTLEGHLCYVAAVAFSPDGRRLASAGEDWAVKVWDLDTGLATLHLTGHRGRVRHLAFSPGGEYLASAGEDGTIRVWPAPAP